jgi:hypothetical protein
MRGVGLEWQIAEFVDDQQLGLGIEAEPLIEPASCFNKPAVSKTLTTDSPSVRTRELFEHYALNRATG